MKVKKLEELTGEELYEIALGECAEITKLAFRLNLETRAMVKIMSVELSDFRIEIWAKIPTSCNDPTVSYKADMISIKADNDYSMVKRLQDIRVYMEGLYDERKM